jgi:glucose-6-phosphate 1-dehydrogenase
MRRHPPPDVNVHGLWDTPPVASRIEDYALIGDTHTTVLRIQPDAGLRIEMQAKDATRWAPQAVDLEMSFVEELGPPPEPYERLMDDALRGDAALFTREDAVEETWRIVQPLLDRPPPIEVYPQGSWGPQRVGQVIGGDGRWHHPWLP